MEHYQKAVADTKMRHSTEVADLNLRHEQELMTLEELYKNLKVGGPSPKKQKRSHEGGVLSQGHSSAQSQQFHPYQSNSANSANSGTMNHANFRQNLEHEINEEFGVLRDPHAAGQSQHGAPHGPGQNQDPQSQDPSQQYGSPI